MSNDKDAIMSFTSTDIIDNSKSTKQQRIVLTEEKFTNTLSSIITRDYFPSLPSLRRDTAILQKRLEGDTASVVQIRQAARNLATHEELKTQSEIIEESIASRNGGLRKRGRPLDRENIDGFHQRVTTEDNVEFELNMKREAKEKKQIMGRLFLATSDNGEEREMDGNTRMKLCDTPIMASDEFNAPVERIQVAGTTVEGKNKTDRNALFFTPQHLTESSDDTIHAALPSQSFADSKMMPPPLRNSNSSRVPIQTSLSTIKTSRINNSMMHLVEYKVKSSSMSNSRQKQIVPSNTRFQYQNESRIVAPATNRSIEPEPAPVALQKLGYDTDSSAATDLDASPISIDLERKRRLQQILNDRNTFVTMTPLIVPGRDDDSPIVTWGDVASTPLAVRRGEESDDVPTQSFVPFIRNDLEFKFLCEDGREAVAKEVEEKLAKQAKRFKHIGALCKIGHETRTKTVQGSKQRSTSTMLDRTLSLTPAARALLVRSTQTMTRRIGAKSSMTIAARSGSAFGSALRNSYTPQSEKSRNESTRKSRSSNIHRATPLASTIPSHKIDKRKDLVLCGKAKVSTKHYQQEHNISTSGLLKM